MTLRYDKRGVGDSEADRLRTGMWAAVADLQAALVLLKAQPSVEAEKIILVGHNEGCMLATAVNAKTPVAGMIFISGAAESLEEATMKQQAILYEDLKGQKGMQGILMRLLQIDKIGERQAQWVNRKMLASTEDRIKLSSRSMKAKWFREHYQNDLIGDL